MERIIIGPATQLDGLVAGRRTIALCDRQVAELYPEIVGRFESIVVEGGEASKTLATVERIVGRLIALGADRDTFLLGIGGGVVTDLTGFVAAVYMRGVRYGLVPTTLLAQADAAIGGKNGVDIGGFKNIVGTFGEPEFVLCDVGFLKTLPPREMRCGMAEVVKAAVIGDAGLFTTLERLYAHGDNEERGCSGGFFSAPPGAGFDLTEVVRRAVEVKVAIVERDRHEKGERRLLNLGHTIGHSIEACAHAGQILSAVGTLSHAEPRREVVSSGEAMEKCAHAGQISNDVHILSHDGPCREVVSSGEAMEKFAHAGQIPGDVTPAPVNHGEAVAVGIAAAAGIAVRLGMLRQDDAGRIVRLLTAMGLPTTIEADPAGLLAAIRADKKNYADGIYFILPTAIGSCTVRRLSIDELGGFLF